jgi:hypothetical protein
MPKYKFWGTITLSGAHFLVTAPDLESARRRAENGDFDEYDLDNTDFSDAEINSSKWEPMG